MTCEKSVRQKRYSAHLTARWGILILTLSPGYGTSTSFPVCASPSILSARFRHLPTWTGIWLAPNFSIWQMSMEHFPSLAMYPMRQPRAPTLWYSTNFFPRACRSMGATIMNQMFRTIRAPVPRSGGICSDSIHCSSLQLRRRALEIARLEPVRHRLV